MFCRKCGSPLPDDSDYCPKCGARVKDADGNPVTNYSGLSKYGKSKSLLSLSGWFSAKGRMARKEFWIRNVILFCVSFAWGLVWGIAGFGEALFYLGLLPASLANIFVYIRRLHDLNASGWWLLLIMFGGALMGGMLLGDSLLWLYNMGVLAVLGSVPGTAGENRYGPDPRTDAIAL